MADIKKDRNPHSISRRILMMRISMGSMPEHFILFYCVSWRIFRFREPWTWDAGRER